MSSKKQLLTLGAGVVIVLLIGSIGLYRYWSADAGTSGQPSTITIMDMEDWEDETRGRVVSAGFEAWDEAKFRSALSQAVEKASLPGMSGEDKDRLEETAHELVGSYWNVDRERFVRLMRSLGLEPHKSLLEEGADEGMASMTRSVAAAPLRYGDVKVDLWARRGKQKYDLVGGNRLGAQVKMLGRSRGDGDMYGEWLDEADVASVAVPAEMFAMLDAKRVETTLVLYLAHRPSDGQWLLVAVAHIGPDGAFSSVEVQDLTLLPPLG